MKVLEAQNVPRGNSHHYKSMGVCHSFISIGAYIIYGSTILTSLELSLLILNSVYIGQAKSTANSVVDGKVNIVSVYTLIGWHVKFVVSVPELVLFCMHMYAWSYFS